MNYLDITILVVGGLGIIAGFRGGLVKEVAGLMAVLLGFVGARILAPHVAPYVAQWITSNEHAIAAIAWVVAFLLIALGVNLIASIISKTLELAMLGGVDKILGAIFGGIKYILLLSILLNLLALADEVYQIPSEQTRRESRYYGMTREVASWAIDWVRSRNINWDKLKEIPNEIEKNLPKPEVNAPAGIRQI